MRFQERRMFPRPLVSRELLRVDRLNRVFQVRELSPYGCSLVWDDTDSEQPFHILQYLQGVLSISGRRVPVQLQVQGVLHDQIRARLFLQSKADESLWQAYFAPQRLADSLRLVPFCVKNRKLLFLGDADSSVLQILSAEGGCEEASIRAREYFLKTHLQEGTQIGYDDKWSTPKLGAVVLSVRESTTEPSQFQEAAHFFLKFLEAFASKNLLNEPWIARAKKEIEDQCRKLS